MSPSPTVEPGKPVSGWFGQIVGFLFGSVIMAWLLTIAVVAIFELPKDLFDYLGRLGTAVTSTTPVLVLPFLLIVLLCRLMVYALKKYRKQLV